MNQLKKLYKMSDQHNNETTISSRKSASSLASSCTDAADDDERLRRLLAVCEEMSVASSSEISETAQPRRDNSKKLSGENLKFEKSSDDEDDVGGEKKAIDSNLSQIQADVSKCIQESILAITIEQDDGESKEMDVDYVEGQGPSSTLYGTQSQIFNDSLDDGKLAIDWKNDDCIDNESSFSDITSQKSVISSTTSSSSKKQRPKRTKNFDEETLTVLKIPCEVFGWIREVSYRSDGVSCDVYYKTPGGGKKFRSMVEIGKYLTEIKSDELTLEHFSFAKRALNCHNEYVRTAHGKNIETCAATASPDDSSTFKTPKSEGKKPKSKIKTVEKPQKPTISTPKPAPKPAPEPEPEPQKSKSPVPTTTPKIVKEKTPAPITQVPALFSEPLLIVKTSKNGNNSVEPEPKVEEKRVEEKTENSDRVLKVKVKKTSSITKKRKIVDSDDEDDSKSSAISRRSESPIVKDIDRKTTTTPKFLSTKKKFKSAHVLSLERDFKLIKKKKFGKDNKSDKESKNDNDESLSSTTTIEKVNGLDDKKIAIDLDSDVASLLSDPIARPDSRPAIEVLEPTTAPLAPASTPAAAETPKTTTTLCTADRACDDGRPRDALCANCLMEFHVDCADRADGPRGRIVATNGTGAVEAKNCYFLCFKCYEELDSAYRQNNNNAPAKIAGDGNHSEKLIEAIKVVVKSPTKTTKPKSAAIVATKKSQFFQDSMAFYQILKQIFANLSVQDLLRVRQVCRMWNDVAMLKEFWELAPLKGCQIKDWSRTSQFLRDQKVHTLDFFGVRTSVNAFVKSLEEMDYLKGLKFGHIVPLVLDVIKNCQKTLCKLETLRFTVTEQKKCDALTTIVVSLELLRHLSSNLRQLRMAAGRFFELRPDSTGHLAKLTNLTHLSMLDMNLGADDARWSFLKSLTNLQVLKVGSCVYWSSKVYELVSQLKNLHSLTLEWGDTLPNDFLSQTLAVLPKLRHLHLCKFSVSATLMSLIASKRQLETLTVWLRFEDQTAKQSWRNLVDGLAKQKFVKCFTLGIGSQNLVVLNDQSNEKIVVQKGDPIRFAAEDEQNPGHLKTLHIDAFTRYAQNFVRFVINKYTKDESLFATRVN